ncbi:hypothetical protein Cgig2_012147 [Carnegiea gigantea]|uniref:Uncharacterized protein n=1 Tax=Carnegiea gigantea TaxID=171969 RepID=A0A9Q1KTA8_9CARY|nr:hypothetical protein Cgig2_012147 [Carnegiea gigantea]
MGFSLGGIETAASSSEHQEIKQLVGASFMASGSSSSKTASSSSTTHHQPQLLHHHHHLDLQQQINQLPHQHHHHLLDHPHHLHQQQQNISFSMMQSSPSSSSFFPGGGGNNKESTGGAYDLGELDQALFLYLDGQPPVDHHPSNSSSPLHHDHSRQNQNSLSPAEGGGGGMRPPTPTGGGGGEGEGGMRPPTLNIFPSQPMHVDPSNKASSGLLVGGGGGGGAQSTSGGSKRPSSLEQQQPPKINQNESPAEPSKSIKREGNRKGLTSSSEQEGPKTPDPKTLRRLAQNREAARKSRLRKKAYVQQLESSRIRLAQLEQELQRARAQGIFFGGGVIGGSGGGGDQSVPVVVTNISSDAAVFDLEYTRWLEEHHRLNCELRAAVQQQLPENELKIYVDNCVAHYDVVMNLKSLVAKTDLFHLLSGVWKTPVERCFMWMGGFRPSELIKIILHQIEPLTEQQLMAVCGLQQSTHEAEEALSQGLEALHQSLSDVIASDSLSCTHNMANYMGQMALAMSKLSTMENFVRQADSLRHQTFHRLHQILTTRQAARCFLAIAEYFHRLRALSSLWLARPRQDQ